MLFNGKLVFLLALGTGLFAALTGRAMTAPTAYLSLVPTATAGDTGGLSVGVYAASNAPVNAYDLTITYPVGLLQLKNISAANSVIDVWQSDFMQADSGRVAVSGGSLRSWSGGPKLLATVNFRVRNSGQAILSFALGSRLLAADGSGTPLPVSAGTASVGLAGGAVSIISGGTPPPSVPPAPPAPSAEFFRIAANPFDPTTDLLVFSYLNDLDPKAVLVSTRYWFFSSPWQIARNPYPISKDTWMAEIKVIDQSGAARSYVVYNPSAILREATELLGLAALLIFSAFFIWKKRTGSARKA